MRGNEEGMRRPAYMLRVFWGASGGVFRDLAGAKLIFSPSYLTCFKPKALYYSRLEPVWNCGSVR